MISDLRCWAFNKDGVRCELEPGHSKPHTMSVTWTDEECYSPIKHQLPVVTTTTLPTSGVVTVNETAPSEPPPCVACGHRHKAGVCKCGCHEHIG